MRILPSSSSSVWPGSTASKICGCGRNTRSAEPALSVGSKRKVAPSLRSGAAAAELADAELRPLQVGKDADRPAEGASPLRTAACSFLARSYEEWLMLMRNTSTPASNRRSIISGAYDAGPRVATILTRRCVSFGSAPPSLGSVRRMVQSLASCVSTSKKPVRLIAALLAILNPPDGERLVVVHMKDLPAHSPPRS